MAVDVTITDNSAAVKAAKDAAVQRALEAIGLEAEKYAKLHLEDSPRRVDTGRLRNSISHAVADKTVYVGTNVEYAPYVEYGTSRNGATMMEANHFLKNAATQHSDRYKEITEMYLKA